MKNPLLELFTSKKFLAALTAVAVYLAGRFGFDLDTAVLDRIYAALLVYVGAQGVADVGKSAAKINAASISAPSALGTVTIPRSPGLAGTAVPLLAVLLLGGAAAMATGCTAAQRTTAEHALWDCTSSQRAAFVTAATPLADSAIAKATNPDGSLDDAAIKALFAGANLKSEAGTVLACLAIETLTARAAAPALSARTAAAASPLGVSAQTALDALRAAQFPGATFRTSAGTI